MPGWAKAEHAEDDRASPRTTGTHHSAQLASIMVASSLTFYFDA